MVRIQNRRDTIKQIGAGIAGNIITQNNSLSEFSYDGDSPKEIVVAYSKGEPVTKTVSEEWWNNLQRVKAAKESLKELLGRHGIVSVGITTGDKKIGGLLENRPFVQYDPNHPESSNVPESIDSMEVDRRQATEQREYHSCYDSTYDPLIGGIKFEGTPPNQAITGSLCCRAYRFGSPYMLAARHIFVPDGNACDVTHNTIGTEAYQPDVYSQSDYFGKVVYEGEHHDMVLIDTSGDDNRSLSNGIVDELYNITGYYTEAGVATLAANQDWVDFRGTTTCDETYQVVDHDEDFSCNGHTFEDIVRLDGLPWPDYGDSGGIHYETNPANPAENLLVGMYFAFDSNDNKLESAAGYGLADEHTLDFW